MQNQTAIDDFVIRKQNIFHQKKELTRASQVSEIISDLQFVFVNEQKYFLKSKIGTGGYACIFR